MKGRFASAIIFALLASPLRSASAEPADPTPAFIAELQAAIRNDGFSQRVVDQAGSARPWRQTIL